MIHPVILCGGSGTRLWPLSRRSYPKQFVQLTGPETLFQACARRLSGSGYAPPTIVTASDFRFIVAEQLTAAGIDPGAILLEPEGRNTAPAVLAAALHISQTDPGAMLLVAPSDHVVPDTAAFQRAVEAGAAAARAGDLVTFGVAPDRPETAYGYLELSAPPSAGQAGRLARFVEKPAAAEAQAMLEAGCYLWNSGIFLFSARAIIDGFETHAPGLVGPVRDAVAGALPDLGFLRLDKAAWSRCEAISLDYAVMERATNLAAVPLGCAWSDLGGWNAVWTATAPDEHGVVTSGAATALDCRDTLLRSESPDLRLVGLGLEGIVAIAMPDAVLVAAKSRT